MNSTAPLWNEPDVAPRGARLDEELHVDVAIVGGGVTGLTAALLLAQAGKTVALLEARHFSAGVTGASTAHLTEAVDARYHVLESRFGAEGARAVRASSRDAIELIAKISGGAAGGCGFERANGYLFAEDEGQLEELHQEFGAAVRAGASVELGQPPLPFSVRGGICFSDQAQIDPASYAARLLEGLKNAADVRLLEGVSMFDVDGSGQLRLTTDRGATVVAEAVLLATHAPFSKLTLQLKLAQYRSYVVAGRIASPIPGLFWDMADPYHYVRSASVGGQRYLVLGGEDHRTGVAPEGGADAPYSALTAYASRFGVSPEIRWSSQVVESADGLPFIGRPDPDRAIYVATGFGGNGMTFGTLAAMLFKDSILGRDNPYAELYSASRIKPLAALGAAVTENIDTAVHLIGDHVRPASEQSIAELPIGCGKILKDGGERLAVYRDHDGAVHALSSVCTHMGCQVAFNPTERSWDCPCHGSRFDIDGAVLDGPATKPLEKRLNRSM